MQFLEREFIPVVLGGDINTYSVARAFHEEYQVKTTIIGKYATGPSYNSVIVDYIVNKDIDKVDVFLKQMNTFAHEHADKKIILLGAGDNYVNMITKYKEQLKENVIVPFVSHKLMNALQKKDFFYNLCDEVRINYPGTVVITKDSKRDFDMPFAYPVILKSSESVHYWDYPFEGQEKVFTIENRKELDETIAKIYQTGYSENLIIQDRVPGNDESMYVLTSYSDQNGKVVMMCPGHVLLEEHTPTGKGNHAVIITVENEELIKQGKAYLEHINYVGFSNFDVKYDSRDGKYKFFEINTRLGRSNYYVTGSGFNIARYLVEDYIYNQTFDFATPKENSLWLVVPKQVAYKYVKQEANLQLMKKLVKEGKYVNPVFYRPDLRVKRLGPLLKTHASHYVKYKRYYS